MAFGDSSLNPQGPIEAPDAFTAFADTERTTWTEAMGYNWELSRMSAGHESLSRLAKISGEEGYMERAGRRKLSPDELNVEFKDIPQKFSEPEYASVAKIMYDTQKKQQFLQRMVDAGPQDAWTKGAQFVQGIAAHVLDPAEAGLTLLTAGSFRAFGIGMAANSAVARVGVNLAENVVGGAMAEGIAAAAANREGIEYTPTDFVINTLGSAVAFEGIRWGGGRLIQGGKGFMRGLGEGFDGKVANTIDRVAMAQLAEGKHIDITPVLDEAELELHARQPVIFEMDTPEGKALLGFEDVAIKTADGAELQFDVEARVWKNEAGEVFDSRQLAELRSEGKVTVDPRPDAGVALDPEKPSEVRIVERPEAVTDPVQRADQMRQLFEDNNRPERKILFDKKLSEEFDALVGTTRPEAPKLTELKALESEQNLQIDEMIKQGLLDEDEVIKFREELKLVDEDSRIRETALKAATVCIGRRA